MTRPAQLHEQHLVLEHFMAQLPSAPAGRRRHEGDRPLEPGRNPIDLIVEEGPRRIGVELRRFDWRKGAMEADARKHLLALECKRLWESASGPCVRVGISLAEPQFLSIHSKKLASAIVAAVSAHVPGDDPGNVRLWPGPSLERQTPSIRAWIAHQAVTTGVLCIPDFPVAVAAIDVRRLPFAGQSSWWALSSYWVRGVDVARIQEILDEKGAKLPAYEHCDEYWLVIHVGGGSGDHMDLSEGVPPVVFFSDFDRAFLVGESPGQCFELRLQAP